MLLNPALFPDFLVSCKQHRPSSNHDALYWTTNGGAPVWNNNSSLTAGTRGPILLEDYHLVEKLANFDRERIPERVVHARGASAKGFFEVGAPAAAQLLVRGLLQWSIAVETWVRVGARRMWRQ
jgi:catalase